MLLNRHILLISDDNYILGMIKGYCVAYDLTLEELSNHEILQENNINKSVKLIIVDLRKQKSSLTKPNLNLLHQISDGHHIPVCAILDPLQDQLSKDAPWIECFLKEPILEQLGNYLRTQFHHKPHSFPERRRKDRRTNTDRRRFFSSSQQASPSHAYVHSSPFSVPEKNDNTYFLGPFEINTNCKSVYLQDKNLGLTCKEFSLFSLLAADVERAFTADEIIQHLWPGTDRANKSDLYQYMHLLRKKVEKDPARPYWIINVKGVGYKLNITPALKESGQTLEYLNYKQASS
ncbi:winged helix-turn-helix domain-containing protein [Methylomarinum sp. Ch1-1]|uniref:Winged helix-turn-helix domain-containing protein n=1 Tax=Methylomarinum roseum TaxID=3067653 RepID=A0AAU7NRL6_9GAMM|nr:winged helix-turn-helix domain-containing protein [Methylomarinum sp. Ch1-1]MDP4520389.1 winged helix-turn-helix domain-containing protein [Methylomarinum sp. Ch1-1]